MQLLKNLQFNLVRTTRKAKVTKAPFYEAIPYYYKPNFIDQHDTYIKRTKEQIKAELDDKTFEIKYVKKIYKLTDIHKDLKERKATAILDYKQFNFSELQLDRFRILVGQRFKQDTTQVLFSCQTYPQYMQNLQKLNEQIFQTIIQAKRAP